MFTFIFLYNNTESLIFVSPWKNSSEDLAEAVTKSLGIVCPACPSNNYQFLELTQYPVRAAQCGFSR